MIKIFQEGATGVPLIVCDICGKPIEKAGDGVAVFKNLMNNGESCEVLHAHKGGCHDTAEERIRKTGALVGWTEMIEHLGFLVQNSGYTFDQLKKRIKDLKDSGF
jgi:hypothetical protein